MWKRQEKLIRFSRMVHMRSSDQSAIKVLIDRVGLRKECFPPETNQSIGSEATNWRVVDGFGQNNPMLAD